MYTHTHTHTHTKWLSVVTGDKDAYGPSIMMDETQNRMNELTTRNSSLSSAKLIQPKSFRPVSLRSIQILHTQLYTCVFEVFTFMQD